jgi:outer membrane protein assembly factor BamD (BamD/ComL family)
MLAQARSEAASGNTSRATGIYRSITNQYPFTNSAAEAAFAIAYQERQTGQIKNAFELFQNFINEYRSSPRFTEAVQQQYELAEEAKGGKKERSVIIVNFKVGTEELVKMYKQVITNAPYGKLAPLSQFSIGEIYQDKGEKQNAIKAYQEVVDNYPSSKEASEAQFRIGAISNISAQKTQDRGNLTDTRDALNTYIATNPTGQRSTEVKTILNQVDEAEAARSLKTGKFYLRQNEPKAAAIYFNEAVKYGSAQSAEEARVLLADLAAKNPEALAETKVNPSNDYTPRGSANLRTRDDYAGPPNPELARLTQKPKMRAEDNSFTPIPLQEPELPTGASSAPASGSLLPPINGAPETTTPDAPPSTGSGAANPAETNREPSLLLPVPPAPVAPAPAAPEIKVAKPVNPKPAAETQKKP